MFGIFMGAQRVVFSLLMAKVIPISRRGRLQAWRNITGSAIAAVLAYVAGRYFIGPNLFGNGYSHDLRLRLRPDQLGLWALQFLLKEPEPPTTRPQGRVPRPPARLPAADQPRTAPTPASWWCRCWPTSARIATPFYILYVARLRSHMDRRATLGLLSFAFMRRRHRSRTWSGAIWATRPASGWCCCSRCRPGSAATVLLIEVHASWRDLPGLLRPGRGAGRLQDGAPRP